MTAITAMFILLLVAMFFALLVRLYSIKKGKPTSKSISSQLINLFGIIPRGLVRELRKVLNSGLKPEYRLKAFINLFLVALFLVVAIAVSIVFLVYRPFGGEMCLRCARDIGALGFICSLLIANISINKVF